MATVSIPTADEIKRMLDAKEKEKAKKRDLVGAVERKVEDLGALLAAKDKELLRLQGEREKLQVDNAKLKDRSKGNPLGMRQALDDLVKKHKCEPADELLRMVMEQQPMMNGKGEPLLDEEGNQIMRFVLDGDTRADILLKMLKFRMPELRATEMSAQLDMNIEVQIVHYRDDPVASAKPANTNAGHKAPLQLDAEVIPA